ncbi:MAG: hypothetical protein AAF551_05915 [Bacteroidota bacterium]
MKLKIQTKVGASLSEVESGFTQELFLRLNPPFPTVSLDKFDGCKKGDKVALILNFIFFKQYWESDIIEDAKDDVTWYFIDRGVKLPFFLKSWTHKHEITQLKNGSLISDDITYSTGTIVTDFLMFPLLYAQFLYRKPIYKKIFKAKV